MATQGGFLHKRLTSLASSWLATEFRRNWMDGSAFHRQRLFRAGVRAGHPRNAAELGEIPPLRLDDIATARDVVVCNPYEKPRGIFGYLKWRKIWPLRWSIVRGIPLGYSLSDIERLGRNGLQLVVGAGVSSSDSVALIPHGIAAHEIWQLEAGFRRVNASLTEIADHNDLATVSASVLVACVEEAEAVVSAAIVAGIDIASLQTVIVVGAQNETDVLQLQALCGDSIAVVRFWAPEGVFGLWGQCRRGTGFHTWLHDEVVELVDPETDVVLPRGSQRAGRIYWTGTLWRAMNMLRLDTGANATAITETCGNCGRESMRLLPTPSAVGLSDLMDALVPGVPWCAEVVKSGRRNRVAVHVGADDATALAQLAGVLVDEVGDVDISSVSADEVQRRVTNSGGERVVDRRADPLGA